MCPALRELMREDMQKANQEGRDEGFARAIVGLVKDGLLPIETGADRMHISFDEMKKLVAQN